MTTDTDIAIIGAGPAGLMAATVGARAGARVMLLEQHSWSGGRLGIQRQPLQGPRAVFQGQTGREFCRRLADDAKSAGVVVSLGSRVTELRSLSAEPTRFSLGYTSADGREDRLLVRAAIVAIGSRESGPTFQGSTLPGVMLAGDAQVAVNIHGRLSGSKVLMVGTDDAGLLIAASLRDAGAEIVAVVDEAPEILGRELNAAPLRDAGVPFLTSSRVLSAQGNGAVESVTVCRLDPSGAVVPGARRHLNVDVVIVAGPRTPESGLVAQTRCMIHDAPVLGGRVPVHDRWMETTARGLYVCGDGAGVENGAISIETGRLAGLRAASELGYVHPKARAQESLARRRLGYLRRGSRGQPRRTARAQLESEHRKALR